jgi:tetratricopeptide (TPR) repeat protein
MMGNGNGSKSFWKLITYIADCSGLMYKMPMIDKKETSMASTLVRITLFSFLFLLSIPHLTFAEIKTFIKEYNYQAGEVDSKNSSRTLALREVKRLLLEELGTFLESVTEVQNFQLTKDQITTLTAGIVKTEIVDEKWDGHTYWLKSKIVADPNEVIMSIDVLRKDREKTKELEEEKRRSGELLMENARLRKELATATGVKKQEQKAAYDKTIKELTAIEWSEKGKNSAIFGRNKAAINELDKAIELDPEDVAAYYWRGLAYEKLGNYIQAINDYSKIIEINPKYEAKSRQLFHAYRNRGRAYTKLGDYLEAIKDSEKAIELDTVISRKQPKPGEPRDLFAEMGINPDLEKLYRNLGNAYLHLGNYNQAIQNYKEAARWESKEAQDYLKKQGIDW